MEILLHIPCWLHFQLGGFSYTSRTGFIFIWGLSLIHPMLALFSVGSFSYTSPPPPPPFFSSFFSRGVSLTHPLLASFFRGVSLTHPMLASFLITGFSLTHPMLALFFIRGVSLTHPMLALFLFGEFLLHIPCWLYFLSGEFLLHIPCWLYFYLGSFSYTSHSGFIFLWIVSLTHPMLASFLYGEFLLNIAY